MEPSQSVSAVFMLLRDCASSRLLYIVLLLSTTATHADAEIHPQDYPEEDQLSEDGSRLIDALPYVIDNLPTMLPPQSDRKITLATIDTKDNSWVDRSQANFADWVDHTAQRIDGWFGESYKDDTAKATVRVIFDNEWDKYDGYEFKPRIRGKIDLPTLERRLSVVFGDDSLDNEIENNIAISNENPSGDIDKQIDSKRIREDNSSIALRWSQLSERLPFELDADLGIRSGDDIYARLKAEKDWSLSNDFMFHAEQIYRYGIDSKNYFRTNLELTHARPEQAFLSNQMSVTYADQQDEDLKWDNRTYRQHQFFHENRFNYGIYVGGYYQYEDLRMNSWGPFVSWRQPVWREWFYVQSDLNFFNDKRQHRDHYARAFVRLEALF